MKPNVTQRNLPVAIIAISLIALKLLAILFEILEWQLSPYIWLFENDASFAIAMTWFVGSISILVEIALLILICIMAFGGRGPIKVLVFVLIGIYLFSDLMTFVSGYLWDSDGYLSWWVDFRFIGHFDSSEALGTLGGLMRGIFSKLTLIALLVLALIPKTNKWPSDNSDGARAWSEVPTPSFDRSASSARFCTSCGSSLPSESAFCGKCGAPVR